MYATNGLQALPGAGGQPDYNLPIDNSAETEFNGLPKNETTTMIIVAG